MAQQNSEAVIRGYKRATLHASPGGAALEGLQGAAVVDFALGGVLVPKLVVEGAAGGGVGGGYLLDLCCLVCSLCVVRSCVP